MYRFRTMAPFYYLPFSMFGLYFPWYIHDLTLQFMFHLKRPQRDPIWPQCKNSSNSPVKIYVLIMFHFSFYHLPWPDIMGSPYMCVYMFMYITVCLPQEGKDSSCTHGLAPSRCTQNICWMNDKAYLFSKQRKKCNLEVLHFLKGWAFIHFYDAV